MENFIRFSSCELNRKRSPEEVSILLVTVLIFRDNLIHVSLEKHFQLMILFEVKFFSLREFLN